MCQHSHACHKHFRTREQAEHFLEEWISTYVEILADICKEELAKGSRPRGALKCLPSLLFKPTSGDLHEIGKKLDQIQI